MSKSTMTREALVGKLGTVFRQHGYEGASLTRLSQATGLVKASLYHQFPRGKEDMAEAVLAALADEIGRLVIAPLADRTQPARARVARMAEGLDKVYDGGRSFCAIDVFGIGDSGRLFRDHLGAAVAGISSALRSMLTEAGVAPAEAGRRAEDALIAIQGALVLARATANPSGFLRVLRELPDRLLVGTEFSRTS